MSTFGTAPTRLNNQFMISDCMEIEVKFHWCNVEKCYFHQGEDLLDGSVFTITQSTSCPSLWHLDVQEVDMTCEACYVADSDPVRLDTAHHHSIIEVALDAIVNRIRESVEVNDPAVQFRVKLTLEN